MDFFTEKSGITGNFAAVFRFISVMYCMEAGRFSGVF